MDVREMLEKREREYLSKQAVCSADSEGRRKNEEPCELRTCFQRDRDRIIHSNSFRRLKHKTQVFLSPRDDHYRTRLTHTLEVAQIARTISRSLCLNEDLTEAVALGHDLGHTPFGHMGEKVLDDVCPGGFRHNEQSLRVVDVLEGGKGLNLTYEVRDGIVNHTGNRKPKTLEGRVVALSDRIAYVNHDLDDAVRGGLLKDDDIPKEFTKVLGERPSVRIDTMIKAVISESAGTDAPPDNSENNSPEDIAMEPSVCEAMMGLRRFLFDRVYTNPESVIAAEEEKAKHIIESLYERLLRDLDLIPKEIRENSQTDDKHIIVADYIASLSDPLAVARYEELFVPKFWVK